MKKIIFCLIFSVTASVAFGQANVPAIVVSTFSTRGQAVTADDVESITELFIAELAKQSGIRVVDRTSIERVVAEMRFQTSDWSNSQKTAQLGAALNAEFLVRGQINQLGQQISVAITALDIKTLEVVSSSTETFDGSIIYNVERDRWGDYKFRSIFNQMPTMASDIARPITTKMNQLAEQRKKEQEEREKQQREQEQSQYSLYGEWYIGDTPRYTFFDLMDYWITDNRKNGTSKNGRLLRFNSDGTVYFWYEDSDSQEYEHISLKGRYTRQNDRLEMSLSGLSNSARGDNWNSRKNEYANLDKKLNESLTYASLSGTIRFINNGNGLELKFENDRAWWLRGTFMKRDRR